ncbi:MAG: hypothetical protein MN733_02390, partial [Nitrososphaera sp.]|nr:hypothetical protein [Nitrososphaera sp.]
EESKIYREIDKVLGQAMIETLETQEEVQGYEMVDVKEVVRARSSTSKGEDEKEHRTHGAHHHGVTTSTLQQYDETPSLAPEVSGLSKSDRFRQHSVGERTGSYGVDAMASEPGEVLDIIDETQADGTIVRTRKVRRPILKKTFALRRIGYKVIPYEDETDSRYSFTTENIVFVNKANPTYRAESTRGDEFLLRHVISIVAEAVAQTKHPEGKEALELQNRLVAEAIRIHDHSVSKR